MNKTVNYLFCVFVSVWGVFLEGCGSGIVQPHELTAPRPLLDNSGKYMCPYTQDGVLAEWTDKAINAKMGAAVGKTAGGFVGQKAFEQIPLVGGWIGSAVGEEVGRTVAIDSCGGLETIKKTSDVSFNSCDDMSVYLYVKHSLHEHYNAALQATCAIYPEFKKAYKPALVRASKEATRK
jgi:hypothetical protein